MWITITEPENRNIDVLPFEIESCSECGNLFLEICAVDINFNDHFGCINGFKLTCINDHKHDFKL